MNKKTTTQKYCLVYSENGKTISEIFDYKKDLKKKLGSLKLDDIKFIIRGEYVQVKEHLTV